MWSRLTSSKERKGNIMYKNLFIQIYGPRPNEHEHFFGHNSKECEIWDAKLEGFEKGYEIADDNARAYEDQSGKT